MGIRAGKHKRCSRSIKREIRPVGCCVKNQLPTTTYLWRPLVELLQWVPAEYHRLWLSEHIVLRHPFHSCTTNERTTNRMNNSISTNFFPTVFMSTTTNQWCRHRPVLFMFAESSKKQKKKITYRKKEIKQRWWSEHWIHEGAKWNEQCRRNQMNTNKAKYTRRLSCATLLNNKP